MGQVCRMCGEAGIDDELERCPRCHQSLFVSEGLPPGRESRKPPVAPPSSPKPVEVPKQSPAPPREKRTKLMRPQPGPPAPPAPPVSPAPPPAPARPAHAPSVESSEFGRWLDQYVEPSAQPQSPPAAPREAARPAPVPPIIPTAGPPARPEILRRSTAKPPPAAPIVEREEGRELASQAYRAEMTEAPRGLDIRKLNIPTRSYEIELFSAPNTWVPMFQLIGMDKSPSFGRSHKMLDQGMETMAERHVRFKNTMGGVEVEPLDSLNGVYLQITSTRHPYRWNAIPDWRLRARVSRWPAGRPRVRQRSATMASASWPRTSSHWLSSTSSGAMTNRESGSRSSSPRRPCSAAGGPTRAAPRAGRRPAPQR